MKEQLKQQVLAIIVGKMIDAGWTVLGTAPKVMNKFFATAVGPKEAQIRIDEGSEEKWWVNGWYWSEGNNVLAAMDIYIPSDMDPELVALKVDAYLVDAEMRIGSSYAARLLHPVQPGKVLEGEVLPPESELMSRGRQLLDDIASEIRAIENIGRR
ncbi:hypothetical protein [Azospira sp. I09]|uniref:hypothetical protein n=1 Tax=Azospira sp. I09 TaxID=1765049 RepID=UPI00126084F2|nr:hypothetical protein [Azospira sp. I09]BBN90741.1 hypothetical protein AZSP09_37640 [Azospira sp. I09]